MSLSNSVVSWVLGCSCALALSIAPQTAEAFCGFYVSGSSQGLYNDATRVSLLRDDQTTVMSMQNNYRGPPEDFAMVVPVPVVLEKKQVQTLDDAIFERLDGYTAPRLVEYWERDPCYEPPRRRGDTTATAESAAPSLATGSGGGAEKSPVRIEAKFEVGEYDIVILSSDESAALEDWLHENDYEIPGGAAKYLKPYVQKGTYFFVARVNMNKVEYEDGEALLSPLRFHYETDTFKLPVRLGLINSKGSQDLIVYTLAKEQRYKVANYPNISIPTNIRVAESVKDNFAGFYTELFNRVMRENPRSVVTEYSWRISKCDPCPREPLDKQDLLTLGADVTAPTKVVYEEQQGPVDPFESDRSRQREIEKKIRQVETHRWVVTRLHTKYSEETLGKDLVFEKAPPIRGGRGMPSGAEGKMPDGSPSKARRNNFQGRYAILHPWKGEIDCENPRRGVWGGPRETPRVDGGSDAEPIGGVGFSEPTPRPLSDVVKQSDIPGLENSVPEYDETTKFPAGGSGDGDRPESDESDE